MIRYCFVGGHRYTASSAPVKCRCERYGRWLGRAMEYQSSLAIVRGLDGASISTGALYARTIQQVAPSWRQESCRPFWLGSNLLIYWNVRFQWVGSCFRSYKNSSYIGLAVRHSSLPSTFPDQISVYRKAVTTRYLICTIWLGVGVHLHTWIFDGVNTSLAALRSSFHSNSKEHEIFWSIAVRIDNKDWSAAYIHSRSPISNERLS